MMADGLLLTYKELSSKFDLTTNIKEYLVVFNALPSDIVHCVKCIFALYITGRQMFVHTL